MHLTTSRIATLEPFSVFFILLMFYFMVRYYYTSFYDTPLKKTLHTLFLCGIFMGIAIATKWTACYSAVGLAVLLFSNLLRRMYEYHHAKISLQHLEELTDSEASEALKIKDFFWKKFWITILCCFVFFIIIPAAIYWLSYLPDRVWKYDSWSIENVWKQIVYMYEYHVNLKATHPYSSVWYMWIVDARPIWYGIFEDAAGLQHSISCFSNPLLTTLGLFAFVFTARDVVIKRDHTAWAIIVGYLSAFVPWLLVTRCVFSYHFYPSSCFLILAIVYLFSKIMDKPAGKRFIQIFLAAYVILFFMFLPVTAGFGTTLPYIKFMEWIPSWYFG
jgi:dolichyl-phosphate-mannose--protein O-mannosyl transferase